jgi:hypothetical protein
MELGRKLAEQCGTATVAVAPLLMLVGAAASVMDADTFYDVLNALTPADDE